MQHKDGAPVLVIGGVVWLVVSLVAAGRFAAWLAGGTVSVRGAAYLVQVLTHATDPGPAVGASFGPVMFWGCWLATLTAGMLLIGVVAGIVTRRGQRRRVDPRRAKGMPSRAEIRRDVGARRVGQMAEYVRPGLPGARVQDIAFNIGRAKGVQAWVPVENSVLLIGPARSGKGQFVVLPFLMQAPGAVVSTSVRAENMMATYEHRQKIGPVAAFVPTDMSKLGQAAEAVRACEVRWSLTGGCDDPKRALTRAFALARNAGRGVEGGDFWRTMAEKVIAPLLMAAELSGQGVGGLKRWANTAALAREAVDILREDERAQPGWSEDLSAVIEAGDSRTRDNIWAQVAASIGKPLMDPAIEHALTPAPGRGLDVREFIRRRGTIYLIADSPTSIARPFFAALVEDMYEQALELANSMRGNRLEPPMHFNLDELANIATLPSLGSMISAGGGAGVNVLAVLQSLGQAREKWSRELADAISHAVTTKIILGGVSDGEALRELSDIVGDRWVTRVTRSQEIGRFDPGTGSDQLERILTPAQIRALPTGWALVLNRNTRPFLVKMLRHSKRTYALPRG